MNKEEYRQILTRLLIKIDDIDLDSDSGLVETWIGDYMNWGEVFKYIEEKVDLS